jgi:anti-sigma regulatory factor (Ser/Thr protein kinase)
MEVTMTPQACIPVHEVSQVGEARRMATRMAQSIGLSETRQAEAAIVATELATNLVRHAGNGRMLVQTLRAPAGDCVEFLAIDSGPGIADLHRCMRDGFSSKGTAGTGLGAIRRLSREFDAYSTPGKGTAVLARIMADDRIPHGPFAHGAVSIPAPHESVCGDAWSVRENDGCLAVMVADGLGHGALAAEAARRAIVAFTTDPFADAGRILENAHQSVRGSRGAAVACAQVTAGGQVRHAGMGNIETSLVSGTGRRGLAAQNGTIGVEIRKVLSSDATWPDLGVLVMHSDGLTSRWSFDAYPGLLVRHPGIIASVLARDFLRGRDDATVVVVSLRREA